MAQFEILNHFILRPLTKHTFILQDSEGKIVYKEWLNDQGKCIDVELRDKDGFSIDDPELVESIQEFLSDQGL